MELLRQHVIHHHPLYVMALMTGSEVDPLWELYRRNTSCIRPPLLCPWMGGWYDLQHKPKKRVHISMLFCWISNNTAPFAEEIMNITEKAAVDYLIIFNKICYLCLGCIYTIHHCWWSWSINNRKSPEATGLLWCWYNRVGVAIQ